jgi:hypothetical protein
VALKVLVWFCFCIGGAQAIKNLAKGLNLKTYSETPISPNRLFEVVADDLQTLNKNLQSVSNAFYILTVFVCLSIWLSSFSDSTHDLLCLLLFFNCF